MPNSFKIRLLYVSYILFFVVGSLILIASLPKHTYITSNDFGRLLGIWAITAMAFQFILSSRFKPLEKGIGLIRIMSIHSFNAKLLLILVILHPLFLGMIGKFEYYDLPHWIGFITTLLLIFIVVASVFTNILKMNYEVWKFFHQVSYLILILTIIHSFLLRSGLFLYWWILMIILAGIGIIAKIFRKTYKFMVDDISEESHNIWTIKLKPVKGRIFNYNPGQFAYIRFFGQVSPEEHHFTISSSPGEKYLTFTVKNLGDFTSTIPKIKNGDMAIIDGPYGVFTNINNPGPFLFIAGGIGITPVMSMLRFMAGKDIFGGSVLLYVLKNENDAVFKEEIIKISKKGWLKVVYKYTEKEGYVDAKLLKKIENISSRTVFLVGPEGMMTSVKKILLDIGVSNNRIFTERFSLK
ncbi:MAG: Oxidoreductase NAD-binding domain protein [Candidatus Woesebacteria bacterium GW2011_GWA1_38_8]|uniref:Oxidoreductase NAD-binding domain protein n=1 Tax=Candidatus Woesebacteria bacterium GW2011_GWA1_38_8 TaxID=1618547 RepID=A0A0G0KXH3_9BACT|nr:MAG: Oxidoreductase NAD-binding domain protein [Candidatus Woesebacteria bacterium GW2011_GWA1_38_8]